MNGFLFLATVSLLVAVQIQMGVLGDDKTNAATASYAAPVITKEEAPKSEVLKTPQKPKPARSGASSLIDVGSRSFFFFANTLMCLLYLG